VHARRVNACVLYLAGEHLRDGHHYVCVSPYQVFQSLRQAREGQTTVSALLFRERSVDFEHEWDRTRTSQEKARDAPQTGTLVNGVRRPLRGRDARSPQEAEVVQRTDKVRMMAWRTPQPAVGATDDGTKSPIPNCHGSGLHRSMYGIRDAVSHLSRAHNRDFMTGIR
jgi:hypothetical protein